MSMSQSFSFGDMKVNLSSTGGPAHGKPLPDTPFLVAVMGDFSGRGNRGRREPLGSRRPIMVDVDNFETVLEKLNPTLTIHVGDGGGAVSISFAELDDFHPDQIYERLDLFKALRSTRKELLDPSTFSVAAARVQGWAVTGSAESTPSVPGPKQGQGQGGGGQAESQDDDMFTRLLGKPQSQPAAQVAAASTIESMLQQIVGPHVVPAPDPRQDQLVAAVDAAITSQMQAILHDPAFQSLEAAWRSLDFLVRQVETDELLKLHVLDLSKEELAADLNATDSLSSTELYKLFVDKTIHTPGGVPWALLAGNYTFDATAEDAQVIGRMAKISSEAGAPFISGAHPRVLGCESLVTSPQAADWQPVSDQGGADAWAALRKLPEAGSIGLALPRVLLRLPYGKATDEIDRFDFEEIQTDPFDPAASHERFLWGNPAFLGVMLLAGTYKTHGWDFSPGGGATVSGLPSFTFKQDGQAETLPCAEAWLTERTADAMMSQGFMPVLSVKNSDAVRLARFQSIADPPKNLCGRWSGD